VFAEELAVELVVEEVSVVENVVVELDEAGHVAVQTVTPSPQSVSDAERQQPAAISSINVL
jgi:hypothetical protein